MDDVLTRPKLGADRGADPIGRARRLGPAIAAAADTIERTRRIPEPLLSELHEARLFRMLLPRSVGGDEVEPGIYVQAIAEAARHDGSVGWCLSIANSTGLIAPYLAPEVARTIFADPRAVVAWGPPNESRARAPDHAATAHPALHWGRGGARPCRSSRP